MGLGETTVYLGIPLTNGSFSNEEFLTANSAMPAKANLEGVIKSPAGEWILTIYEKGKENKPIYSNKVKTGQKFGPKEDIKIGSNLVIGTKVEGSNGEYTTLEGTITIKIR